MGTTSPDQSVIPAQLRSRPPARAGAGGRLVVEDPAHVALAARHLADGGVVGHGFANIYALTTRPDSELVQAVNVLKGRPPTQVGSIVTTPLRIPDAYDWSRLPRELDRERLLDVMDALLAAGPCGFRGPAARHLPDHLTSPDGELRTAQVIAPGWACPSNAFLAAGVHASAAPWLYITSANRSHWQSGAAEEPAHYRADGLAREFGRDPRFLLLEHTDEAAARHRYPRHDPMSTTVLAIHRTAGTDEQGRLRLIVERHGSLPLSEVELTVAPLGFAVALGPQATRRLTARDYAATPTPPSP